ncbi:MAG: DOMON domain-containing protein [Candidatus Brocadiia bacterium]
MKKILSVTLLCAIVFGLTACEERKAQTQPTSPPVQAENKVTAAGVTMEWSLAGTNLSVKLSAATSGWVAVGFDPGAGMKDANIIIGYVKDGNAIIRDDFGTGFGSHAPDTVDNVTNKSGTEANGVTEISFTIPLDSADAQDKKLVSGNSYKVLLASGNSDDFSAFHTHKAVATIKIP